MWGRRLAATWRFSVCRPINGVVFSFPLVGGGNVDIFIVHCDDERFFVGNFCARSDDEVISVNCHLDNVDFIIEFDLSAVCPNQQNMVIVFIGDIYGNGVFCSISDVDSLLLCPYCCNGDVSVESELAAFRNY